MTISYLSLCFLFLLLCVGGYANSFFVCEVVREKLYWQVGEGYELSTLLTC